MLLGGELYNAPISSSPQNILDLGTGTGIWALDIAEYVKSSIRHYMPAGLNPG
jgi:ubiquinone/menaquinone biosynthesis C-methylase UbiE